MITYHVITQQSVNPSLGSAARNPRRYLGAVWLLVWLELLHGVLDDIYLIARGYDMVGYLVFIAIHLAIIITGVVFGRQAEAEVVGA